MLVKMENIFCKRKVLTNCWSGLFFSNDCDCLFLQLLPVKDPGKGQNSETQQIPVVLVLEPSAVWPLTGIQQIPFFSISSPVKCTTKICSSGKALQVQSIILATCHENFVQVEPNYSVGMLKAKFCQVCSLKWVVHRLGALQSTVCTCIDCVTNSSSYISKALVANICPSLSLNMKQKIAL